MSKVHGNVKCDCGHRKKDHYDNSGWCHHAGHQNPGKCGCTWYNPNVRYIKRKKIDELKKRQLKLELH
jgi:hypothetical protein